MTFLVVASRIIAYSRTLADVMLFVSAGCNEEISIHDEVKVPQEVYYRLLFFLTIISLFIIIAKSNTVFQRFLHVTFQLK